MLRDWYSVISGCILGGGLIKRLALTQSQVTQWVKYLPAVLETEAVMSSIPGSGRSPGRGHGNPLQYSCLENSMDRGAWWAFSPWGHKQSNKTEATEHVFMQQM